MDNVKGQMDDVKSQALTAQNQITATFEKAIKDLKEVVR